MLARDLVKVPVSDVVFVPCQLSQGGFSSERIFRLRTVGDEEFVGSAPVQYCRTKAGALLKPEEPPKGKPMPGLVAARVIRKDEDGSVWLYFPDGSIAQVSEELVSEPQRGKTPDVPLQS